MTETENQILLERIKFLEDKTSILRKEKAALNLEIGRLKDEIEVVKDSLTRIIFVIFKDSEANY